MHRPRNSDDELANDHTDSAPNKQRTTAETLDRPPRDGRRADVHQRRDQRNQKRIVDGTQLFEEGCAEVKDKIYSGPLL